jgi:hypothetical protein
MDEQLQKLLEEADRRQYDSTQKEELVQWYLNNQRPTQPADTGGYLQTKYKKREKTPGALQQLGSAAWSAITDQLPGGFAAGRASSESAIADSDTAFEDSMVLNSEDVPYTLAGEGFNAPAYRAKVLAYQKEKLGEAEYEKQRSEFKNRYKTSAVNLIGEAKKQEAEAQEKTKGNTTNWDQVHNVGDVIRYGASAIGEGIGSSIPAAATAGVSAYVQEQGGAYREAVEETAKALSNQYGEEWTAEDVIKLGYDKPAQEYSNNVALFNTALESVGLLSVFGKAVTPFIKTAAKKVGKSALKQGLKTVATGVVGEGVTEFLQESATQYGALKAAGKTDEEIFGSNGEPGLFDWNRSVEAGVRGGIGGGGLSTVSAAIEAGSTAQPKTRVGDPKLAKQELKLTEKRQQAEEKIAQKEGERLARQEQIDAISNEAIDEELNEGTEEDVDEFTTSIVDLLNEKERNEEIAKVEKETVKLEEEKAKVVEKAITTLEKQEAKEIEKQDNKTEQTQTATESTAVTSIEPSSTANIGREPVQGESTTVEATVQPTVTPEAKPVRRRGRPAKVKIQEPVVATPVEQAVVAQETAKVEPEVAPELKVLQDKKAEIVNRNKGVPQYDDRGNLNWSPKDQADFREVNKQIKEFTGATKVAARTPEQAKQFEDLKTGGLDDDTAAALTDADRVLEMTPDQMGFKDVKRTERVKNTWTNIKELERKDYVQSTKESLPKDIQDTWGPAIDKMVEVIDRTLNNEGNTFRVFEADPAVDKPTAALGMAYADSGNFYIVNSRQQKANTKVHELAHVFEFAVAERQAQQKNTKDVFKEIDEVHKDVVRTLRQEVRAMRKTLGFDKKQFKENFNKLTNEQKLLVLYVTKGDLSRFDLDQINSLDDQLASAVTTTSPTKTTPVYGLTNGREMLAEAISNPYFTGLLANLQTTTGGKKITLLEKLYRAFESVLNNISELLKDSPIAKRYNIKLPSYNTFKNSYLNRLLETLEENLTDLTVDDGDVMNEVLDLPQLPEEEPKRKATGY